MELTEEDKVLLMCAFEVENVSCEGCINDQNCGDKTYWAMSQDLLLKMGVIKEKTEDWQIL